MKVNKQQAKHILQQLSPEELSLYKQFNTQLDGMNEADVQSALKNIVGNWKGFSTAMLMAIMMNSNMANAINNYSPQTFKAINTELATDTTSTPAPTVSVPGSVKSVNFGENFDSGKATLTNKQDLVNKLSDLQTWMKGKDTSNFKLVITAGESQVTNPKGFEAKGSLAAARAKAVESVISKMGFGKVNSEIKIGTTPYEKGNNVDDPKYKAEQFVTIDIVVDNDICSMAPIDVNSGQGVAKTNYVTYDKYISGAGTISFTPGQIPDRLVILDANGNIKEDTGYITTQTSKYKDWTYTPAYVLELTLKYQSSPEVFVGSSIKKITVKDYEDLKSQLSSRPNAPTAGDEIGGALVQMQKMIENGKKEFIFYENGKTAKVVNFNDARGDVKVIVYSPVGKTGFGIKGNCR